MPKTITKHIVVYTFDELSDTAKEAAVNEYRCDDNDNHWQEWPIDDAKEQGKERGFDIEDVRYTGFWSQGDGASWQGSIDIGRFLDYHLKDDNPDHARYVVLRELLRNDWIDRSVEVSYSGSHYCHSGYMTVAEVQAEALAEEVDHGNESATLPEGVLEGANVHAVAQGIDAGPLLHDLDEWMKQEAREYADGIYRSLEEAYEYEYSEENFKELAEANEWRFTEDGALHY